MSSFYSHIWENSSEQSPLFLDISLCMNATLATNKNSLKRITASSETPISRNTTRMKVGRKAGAWRPGGGAGDRVAKQSNELSITWTLQQPTVLYFVRSRPHHNDNARAADDVTRVTARSSIGESWHVRRFWIWAMCMHQFKKTHNFGAGGVSPCVWVQLAAAVRQMEEVGLCVSAFL